jgi:hypothetical protein
VYLDAGDTEASERCLAYAEEVDRLRAERQVANEQRDQAQRWYREKCAEVEALKRTVSFMEQSYLEEHGHWGNCQWRIRYEQLKSREITDEQIDAAVGYMDLACVNEKINLAECGLRPLMRSLLLRLGITTERDGLGWIREEHGDE